MAYQRGVTGVETSTSFLDAVQRTIQASQVNDDPVCVACMGVRNLGPARQQLGMAETDALLEALHQALAKSIRGGDILARLEEDRFGFVLHGCEADILEIVGRRLVAQALKVVSVAGAGPTGLDTCLGIAFFGDVAPTNDSEGPVHALRQAQHALSEAIEAGLGRMVIKTF
jgi:GGDEF domain-containing protein